MRLIPDVSIHPNKSIEIKLLPFLLSAKIFLAKSEKLYEAIVKAIKEHSRNIKQDVQTTIHIREKKDYIRSIIGRSAM